MTRGYWISVAMLYLVAYSIVWSWSRTANQPDILLGWGSVLTVGMVFSAYVATRHRENTATARVALAVPLLVILGTGVAGRWPFLL